MHIITIFNFHYQLEYATTIWSEVNHHRAGYFGGLCVYDALTSWCDVEHLLAASPILLAKVYFHGHVAVSVCVCVCVV